MKINTLLLISALITVNIAYPQLEGLDDKLSNFKSSRPSIGGFVKIANSNKFDKIEGSAYINENFVPAKISTAKNKVYYVRYNAFNDEMEIKGENDIIYGLNKERENLLINFSNPKQTYQLFDYTLDSNDLQGYFIKINFDSDLLLLRKERIVHVDEKISATTYGTNRPAHFKRAKDNYFIKVGENNAIELPKNKKEIAKLFPEFENETLSFIKKNKIKLKNETDLLKLIEYLNSDL